MSRIEYTTHHVDVTDNKTGKTFRLYVDEKENEELFSNPDKYMKKYLKKNPLIREYLEGNLEKKANP